MAAGDRVELFPDLPPPPKDLGGPAKKKTAKTPGRPAPAKTRSFGSRSRPAPALGVMRENKPRGVKLYERYGLVFDPEAEENPITKGERDALIELYSELTGRDITSESDTLTALQRANLVAQRQAGARAASRLRQRLDVPEFASAADALDWLRENRPSGKKEEDGGGPSLFNEAVGNALDSLSKSPAFAPVIGGLKAGGAALTSPDFKGGSEWVGDQVGEVARTRLGGVPGSPTIGEAIGGAYSKTWDAIQGVDRAIGDLPNPTLRVTVGRDGVSFDGRAPSVRETDAEANRQIAADIGAFAGRIGETVRGIANAPLPTGSTSSVAPPAPRVGDLVPSGQDIANLPVGPEFRVGGEYSPIERRESNVLFESPVLSARVRPGRTLRDEALGITDTRVSDQHAQKVTDDLLAGADTPERIMGVAYLAQMAYDGEASSDIEAAQKSANLGPLNAGERQILVGYARGLGWSIADPGQYTDAELLRRAFSRNTGETRRSLVRQVAQFSSLPAGMVAIGREIASGDPNRILGIVEQSLQPYAYVRDDASRRGWPAALESFAKERPVDAALLFSAVTRGTGRGLGVAGRTVGLRGNALPQLLLRSRYSERFNQMLDSKNRGVRYPARAAQWIGEKTEANRPIAINTGSVRKGDDVVDAEYVIGYTSPNLFSTLALVGRRALAQRVVDRTGSLGWAARKTIARRSARTVRRIKNKSDDAAARASLALQEVAVGLNRKQLVRLALELTSAMVKPTQLGGGRYSFAERSEHWRARAEQARANADLVRAGETVDAAGKKLSRPETEYRKDAILFERQARFFDDVARTELDPEVVQRARDAMRVIGDDNDTIVALVLENLGYVDDPRSLQRSAVRASDLRAGDRIDIGDEEVGTIPARVRSVEALPNGGVRVEQQNILEPSDVRVVNYTPLQRATVLRPGVNDVKYLRQWLEWEEALRVVAQGIVDARNALSKADLAPFNRAVNRLEKLDAQIAALNDRVAGVLEKMEEARTGGKLARSRQLRRSYEKQVSALLRKLREKEQVALTIAAEARKADRNDPLVAQMEQLAADVRAARREVVVTRGVGGRAPFRTETLVSESQVFVGGRVPIDMRNRDWNDVVDDPKREQYVVPFDGRSGWNNVEYVLASELRGMEGNAVDARKVDELRGQEYNNPLIVDYDPKTGRAYISEGNHRLAAATDDQYVPVRVIVAPIRDRPGRRTKAVTYPEQLIDRNGYIPSNVLPHELGFAVRGVRRTERQEGRLLDDLPGDPLSARQERVRRTVAAGETPPLRSVDQPEARRRLERAEGLEERASALDALRARLDAERAEAPSASQAGAARRELADVERDIGTLVRQSGVVRATRDPKFDDVLDDLVERLLFVESKRMWPDWVASAKSRERKARRLYLAATRAERAEARQILTQLDEQAKDGKPLTQNDLDALERAESLVVGVEARTKRYKSVRTGRIDGASKSFGKKRVRAEVEPPRERPRRVLDKARGREARADALLERLRARDEAPSAADLREVGKMVKGLRKSAAKERRAAERILANGKPLVDGRNIRAVLDASSGRVAIEVEKRKPARFTMDQVLGEMKQEFIARAEMTGDDPVLWLGTKRAMFGVSGRSWKRESQLGLGPSGGIGAGRLMTNTGQISKQGLESWRRVWENLIADVGEIRGAIEWQRQMRTFIEAVALRVDDVTAAEARMLNETLAELLPENQRQAFLNRASKETPDVELSEAEAVVWDARQFVAVNTFDGKVVGRDRLDVGAVTDTAEDGLSDLFKRSARPVDMAKEGGSYLLIPRFLYNTIIEELDSISYRPGGKMQRADSITKQWRNFTLNILPRTGFANLLGSAALAILAGAGPKSFYLAYRHLKYGDVPAPVELRQRFGMTLTTDVDFAWLRDNQSWLDSPLGGLAWWMNMMRRFNGISEDFGRLAVWYSKAYPEAKRLAGEDFRTSWRNMRGVTEEAELLLKAFADNDPNFENISQRFVDSAFEFVGDLHSGGKVNATFRIAIPFQQWYRHILRLMFITMPIKYPGRSLLVQKISEIGNEYLKEHGVLAPWEADMIPIYEEEKTDLGEKQKYILAWRSGAVNPLSTGSSLATGDVLDWADYGLGALAPIWKNGFLIGVSVLQGEAQTTGGDAFTRDALNQYGNPIRLGLNMETTKWLANMGMQILPLSSTAVSSSGQAAEGNVLWGGDRKLLRGEEGVMPVGALPPDTPGRDVAQSVGMTWDILTGGLPLSEAEYGNYLALATRFVFGGNFGFSIGAGPVQQSQFKAMMGNVEAQFSREINNKLKTLEAKIMEAERVGDTQLAEDLRTEQEETFRLKNR